MDYTKMARPLLMTLMVTLGAWSCVAAPQIPDRRPLGRQVPNVWPDPRPEGNELLLDAQIGNVLRSAPTGAKLVLTKPVLGPITDRLIDNATLIRPNIVDTFRCEGRVYGYYADQDNECQLFHVCLPLHQLYPDNFTIDYTYQFSFICPEYTIFSQDAMVCAWTTEAVPCEYAHELYWMNQNFFREIATEDGFGTKYAEVNEPLR